ncbi:MAG: hypothetical protein ACTSVA_07480 [Candidatus Njordarchaeales archaeon]
MIPTLVIILLASTTTLILSYKQNKTSTLIPRLVLIIYTGSSKVTEGEWGKDYTVIAQVEVIPPSGSPVTVYNGILKQPRIILEARENTTFGRIVASWVESLEKEEYVTEFETSLFLSLWVILRNGTVYRVVPDIVVPYSPMKIMSRMVTAYIDIGGKKLVKVDQLGGEEKSGFSKQDYETMDTGVITYIVYRWEVVDYYEVNYSVPVMIINNPDNPSGKIQGWINIAREKVVGARATIAYGIGLYDALHDQNFGALTVTIYTSDKVTFRKKASFGDLTERLGARMKGYIYINATPATGYYKETKWRITEAGGVVIREEFLGYTGYEKVQVWIKDIKTEGTRIIGGYSRGLLSEEIMDWLFQGTSLKAVKILKDPQLSDGDLDPGETAPLDLLYDISSIDAEKYYFNIGVPVGAIIAGLLSVASGGSLYVLAPLLSALTVDLGYFMEEYLYINGGLKNWGTYSEVLYMAVSKYKYEPGFDAPAGTYFYFPTSRPTSPPGGCPYLLVYTQGGFVNEGLLDIHSVDARDVVRRHYLGHVPVLVWGKFVFRLVEHNATISYIDSVRLYALLGNGSLVEIPLVRAVHNVFGDVTSWLLWDDDARIVLVGSYHLPDGCSSNVLTLEFQPPEGLSFKALIFEIQGHNRLIKV